MIGETTRNIERPSILGLCSTVATSESSSAKRSNTLRPISLCVIARPRNRMETLTLSSLERNFFAFLSFVLKRSEEHTSELQSRFDLVCRLLLEKKKRDI